MYVPICCFCYNMALNLQCDTFRMSFWYYHNLFLLQHVTCVTILSVCFKMSFMLLYSASVTICYLCCNYLRLLQHAIYVTIKSVNSAKIVSYATHIFKYIYMWCITHYASIKARKGIICFLSIVNINIIILRWILCTASLILVAPPAVLPHNSTCLKPHSRRRIYIYIYIYICLPLVYQPYLCASILLTSRCSRF